MSFRAAAAVAVSTLACTTVVVAVTEQAAMAQPPLRFSQVQYNSPGSDRGANSSINAEWARITNYGSRVRTLTGWTVRDQGGHVYRFREFRLRPGATVTLHSGIGRNTGRDVYWRDDWYVWNNDGDRAVLSNQDGARVDTCSWGAGRGITGC